MTDRKKAHRRRRKAGYRCVFGYTTDAEAEQIQARLMTAEEVDKLIEEKGDGD